MVVQTRSHKKEGGAGRDADTPPQRPPSPRSAGFLSSFAGMQEGRFFGGVPPHVDRSKAPGRSPIPAPTAGEWLWNALTLQSFIFSPNLVWASIALAFYFAFPYDLSPTGAAAQGPLSWAFFLERFPLFFAVTILYDAFWHVTLYALDWAKRPFLANRPYNWQKLLHNLFWSFSGVVIWTAFDNVFAFLWASGRLPYLSDQEAFSSAGGMARFLGGLLGVAMWRDVHFYFAHRLLHFKPLYQQVHSLHHRNTDIEPFAGLCMHPVEHLYYYACVLPSLFIFPSPMHFLWNGIHLLLSPGASHSGWEDHFQSDSYHYMHHRYFECNYAGTGAAALDVMFGTFMAKFKDGDGAPNGSPAPRADAKSNITSPPTLEFVAYLGLSAACVGLWAYAALVDPTVAPPAVIAAVAGFGPVAVAFIFSAFSSATGGAKNTPFSFMIHLVMGSLCCALPISWAAYLTLV